MMARIGLSSSGTRLRRWIAKHGNECRLAARVTVAAISAFAIGRALGLQQGYWAVFTAIVVMQASTGGSSLAALEYFIGTLAGAIYGTAVALIVPTRNVWMLGVALTLSVAPLAFIAALRRDFRVAPITAVIVLIIPSLQHVNAFDEALGRVIEIAIGSGTGIVVSHVVFPARTYAVVADTTADILHLSARLVAQLFAGFGEKRDLSAIVRLQDEYRRLLSRLESVVSDAARERANHLSSEADAGPILRSLRRLRFDYVVIGRAASVPFHEAAGARLLPALEQLSKSLRGHLGGMAQALNARRELPSLDPVTEAFAAYTAAMNGLRRAGLTPDLSDDEVARIFTLGFALDQIRLNLGDLQSRVAELFYGK